MESFISVVQIFSLLLFLHVSITVLSIKPLKLAHALLGAAALVLLVWTLVAYVAFNADYLPQSRGQVFLYTSIIGLFLFLSLQNLFVRSVTGRIRLPYVLLVLIPTVFLVIYSILEGIGWKILSFIYFLPTFGGGIALLIFRYRISVLTREKKQISILLLASSLSLVLYLVLALPVPRLVPVFFAPWAVGYLVAMKEFQLLNITPEMMTRHILESVDELVILIDPKGRVNYINNRAVHFFGGSLQKLDKLDFNSSSSLPGMESDMYAISEEKNGKKRRIILHSIDGEGKRRILDMEVCDVTDTFNDPMGFLLVGKEIEILDGLCTGFSLTGREIDVIYCILKGWKTAVIANHLRIAERTVKSHIGSVYIKLGISNRVDLINMLLDGRV